MKQKIKEKLIKERNDLAFKIYKLNRFINNYDPGLNYCNSRYLTDCIYQCNLMNQYLKVLNDRIKLLEEMK